MDIEFSLAITKHFATALSRLLNALQAGGFGYMAGGVVLATLLLTSITRTHRYLRIYFN
jgi:hypothetical protein